MLTASNVGVNQLQSIQLFNTQQLSQNFNNYTSSKNISPFRRYFPIQFVPEKEAWIIETAGKFSRVTNPGVLLMIPLLQQVSYVQSLKVITLEIPNQPGITMDNVTIKMDGVLYFQVVDPKKASYGVTDVHFAVQQLAMSTMRAEIGKLPLEKIFQERSQLNERIMDAINSVVEDWGVSCMRYEIKDISPPEEVMQAMQLQVVAERKKRETIIDSEGERTAEVNVAEGRKQANIFESEAERIRIVNKNKGIAEAIQVRAEATAKGMERLAQAIRAPGGQEAMNLHIAQKYVEAFSNLAKKSNTVLLPSNAGDVSSMVAQAVSIFKNLDSNSSSKPAIIEHVEDANSPKVALEESEDAQEEQENFNEEQENENEYDEHGEPKRDNKQDDVIDVDKLMEEVRTSLNSNKKL